MVNNLKLSGTFETLDRRTIDYLVSFDLSNKKDRLFINGVEVTDKEIMKAYEEQLKSEIAKAMDDELYGHGEREPVGILNSIAKEGE